MLSSKMTAIATGAVLIVMSSIASAQEPQAPAPPPPAATPPAAAPSPASVSIAPTVRVRVRLARKEDVVTVMRPGSGEGSFVCRAPCTFDGLPNEKVRVVVEGTDEPLDLVVANEPGGIQDVEVRHRGTGLLIGGLVTGGVGVVDLLLGVIILESKSTATTTAQEDSRKLLGTVMVVLGAVALTAGVAMITARSTGPVLVQPPTTRSQALQDLAPSRAAFEGLPPPRTDFGWTTTF
jgi:hypothetical protein